MTKTRVAMWGIYAGLITNAVYIAISRPDPTDGSFSIGPASVAFILITLIFSRKIWTLKGAQGPVSKFLINEIVFLLVALGTATLLAAAVLSVICVRTHCLKF